MPHAARVRRVLFVAVTSLSIAAAPSPGVPPAPPPPPPAAPAGGGPDDSARGREVFLGLVQQGTNALLAGEYRAALATLLDAKQVFERKVRGKGTAVGGPEHVAMLHGLALAYQLVEKPDKASPLFEKGTPLDRACTGRGAPRQLLLTRAALDLTQGYLAMRTAVGISDYLKERPNELDSEMLDVFFTALTKAEERVASRAMLDAMIKSYEEFNGRLEATKPGQKRWGVKWVSEGQFRVEMRKRQAALRDLQAAQDRVADADAEIRAAKAAVNAARIGNGSASAANARLARAETQRGNAVRAVEDARRRLPEVPVLGKADLVRIIEPHVATVVIAAKPAKDAAPTQVASAESSKAVPFTLGGPATGTKSGTGGGGGAVSEPPVPPVGEQPTRRSFTRGATGFAVGPDVLLTAAAAVKDAKRIVIEFPGAPPIEAVVERTGPDGLALLRVRGQKLAYLNLAAAFSGGPVQCPAYPEVSVFGVAVETIKGRAMAAKDDGWSVSLGKHPRLAGAPLLDAAGDLVGVEMAERDDLTDRLPALSLDKVRAFLGSDLPGQPCANPKAAAVVQVTGSFER